VPPARQKEIFHLAEESFFAAVVEKEERDVSGNKVSVNFFLFLSSSSTSTLPQKLKVIY
jgi:hypothetical protein